MELVDLFMIFGAMAIIWGASIKARSGSQPKGAYVVIAFAVIPAGPLISINGILAAETFLYFRMDFRGAWARLGGFYKKGSV